ncbi:uncharacterized protein LOC143481337 [Brachyhypopomus gauderio]|uniref:uncharacterized protein LOC143481337 n=1 Tax=Brachyhypopomus gauderio TaxID=698409 RepID=UPI0040436238
MTCEGQNNSTGWRQYIQSGSVSGCSFGWGSVTGSTCTISSLYPSHTGVYWCESESGGSSNPVNITVHSGNVILDSPVHHVTEGDPLTLYCLLRPTDTSDLRADFYKDGFLIQNQTAGEMTIHTVSKSDEGLYHCKHPERGESPHGWVLVRAGDPPPHVLVGLSVGLSLVLLLILLVLLWCYKTRKDTSQILDQTQRESRDSAHTYDRADTDEAADNPSDVTYAQVMIHNKIRNEDRTVPVLDSHVIYSQLLSGGVTDTGAGSSDVTYAEVKIKPKKIKQGC